MGTVRERVSVLVGVILAILMQIVLAPSITLLFATPNFMLVFCVIMAISIHSNVCIVAGFVLGLCYNLIGTGHLGLMAVCLLLISFVLVAVVSVIEGNHPIVAIPTMLISFVLVEMLYALLCIITGTHMSFFDACVYSALPNVLYDMVVALVLYPVLSHLFAPGAQTPHATFSNVRMR